MIFFPLHSVFFIKKISYNFFFSMHQVDDINIFDILNINKIQKVILKIITFITKYRYNKNML